MFTPDLKWVAAGAVLATAGLTSLAGAGLAAANETGIQALSQEQVRQASNILICARTLVQRPGRYGEAGVEAAAESMDQLTRHLDDLDGLRRIHLSCRNSLKTIQKEAPSSMATISPTEILGTEGAGSPYSARVRHMLQVFRSPEAVCTLAGPEVAAALGVGGTLGAHAGLCKSTDGRQTLALGLEAGLLVGAVAAVGLSTQQYSLPPGQLAEASAGAGWGVVLGGGARFGSYEAGVGGAFEVGLGWYRYRSGSVAVQVLPLGTHRKRLVREFLSEGYGEDDDGRSGTSGSVELEQIRP
jgi:hypothetical protein